MRRRSGRRSSSRVMSRNFYFQSSDVTLASNTNAFDVLVLTATDLVGIPAAGLAKAVILHTLTFQSFYHTTGNLATQAPDPPGLILECFYADAVDTADIPEHAGFVFLKNNALQSNVDKRQFPPRIIYRRGTQFLGTNPAAVVAANTYVPTVYVQNTFAAQWCPGWGMPVTIRRKVNLGVDMAIMHHVEYVADNISAAVTIRKAVFGVASYSVTT